MSRPRHRKPDAELTWFFHVDAGTRCSSRELEERLAAAPELDGAEVHVGSVARGVYVSDAEAEFTCIRISGTTQRWRTAPLFRAACNAALATVPVQVHQRPDVHAFRDGRRAFSGGPRHKARYRRRGKQGDRRRVRRAVRQALHGQAELSPPRTGGVRMPGHHARPHIPRDDLDAAQGDPEAGTP